MVEPSNMEVILRVNVENFFQNPIEMYFKNSAACFTLTIAPFLWGCWFRILFLQSHQVFASVSGFVPFGQAYSAYWLVFLDVLHLIVNSRSCPPQTLIWVLPSAIRWAWGLWKGSENSPRLQPLSYKNILWIYRRELFSFPLFERAK